MIRHHPSMIYLGNFASGTLDNARSFVVAAHVRACAKCLAHVRRFEDVGGALLADQAPVAMNPGAAEVMLAAILQKHGDAGEHLRETATDLDLSTVTSTFREGPWRWLGPGLGYRILAKSDAGEARVFLLKAAPGTSLPDHTHTGTELTLVLSGTYVHHAGRFGPGDFEEADSTIEHQPVAEDGETCICLVAMDGQLRLKGLSGRLKELFIRV